NTSKNQHEKTIESRYFMYADTYALILSKQGKNKEAIEYQKPVAYSIKKGKGDKDGVIERYIEFMSKDKQFKAIEEEASQFIKDGNGTQHGKEYVRKAYGSTQEASKRPEDYLTGLEAEAEEMLIAEVQKKMTGEEAPDFTLTNLNIEEG